MRLPIDELQQSLDTIWPFEFSVEDDGESIRIYSVDLGRTTSVFDLYLIGPPTEAGEEVYWGPFKLVFLDNEIGVWGYRKPLYFAPALAMMIYLMTYDDLSRMTMIDDGLPPEDWERFN